MDLNFEAQLNTLNEAYKEAKAFNNWLPDDGEYTALITNVTPGSSPDQNIASGSYLWWRLTAELLCESNPDLNGREYTLGFYSSKALGSLKSAVGVLSGNAPVENDIRAAHQVLMASIGAIVKNRIETKINRKTKASFRDSSIVALIEPAQASSAPASSTPQA